jgi:hypothetical protein
VDLWFHDAEMPMRGTEPRLSLSRREALFRRQLAALWPALRRGAASLLSQPPHLPARAESHRVLVGQLFRDDEVFAKKGSVAVRRRSREDRCVTSRRPNVNT